MTRRVLQIKNHSTNPPIISYVVSISIQLGRMSTTRIWRKAKNYVSSTVDEMQHELEYAKDGFVKADVEFIEFTD